MARYYGSVTVPLNTLASAPATAWVDVAFGTVAEFYRLFPPGCSGMVHLQVFWQTRQIFPLSPGASYLGDGSEILGKAGLVIDEVPATLQLRAWSPGTAYQHIIYCEFYIAEPTIFIPVPISQVGLPWS